MTTVRFVVAGDPAQVTGGYLYDARIVQALRQAGWRVETVGLPGRFPDPDDCAAQALATALAGFDPADLVVIDGLVLGGLPEVLERYARALRMVALIHHPLADEYGLASDRAHRFRVSERQALGNVRRVVASSAFTARHLIADYGVPADRVDVVEPGTDRPDPSVVGGVDRDGPVRLLCVATLVPRKGHRLLVEALAEVRDLAWSCECVGDVRRDLACAEAVRREVDRLQLGARIALTGVLPPAALARKYREAQVFVLPSHYEGYGMVAAEALAYGLPIVTTTGGALRQTVPAAACLRVPPGNPAALADALRRVIVDTGARARLAAGARAAARALPDWAVAGAHFADALSRAARQEEVS
ncbi:D-inositol-3-phosphate glycosyltransferase [Castellaniella defragrans]